MDKVEIHAAICDEIKALYARKNHDYGDSFGKSFEKEGFAAARIRMGDKMNRIDTLTRGEKAQVQDESIRDTFLDLANYAIMTLVEMEVRK